MAEGLMGIGFHRMHNIRSSNSHVCFVIKLKIINVNSNPNIKPNWKMRILTIIMNIFFIWIVFL